MFFTSQFTLRRASGSSESAGRQASNLSQTSRNAGNTDKIPTNNERPQHKYKMSKKTENSLLQTSYIAGRVTAKLRKISESKEREVQPPVNYSIRFHPEVHQWLSHLSLSGEALLDDPGVNPVSMVSVQKVAIGILEQVRIASENAPKDSEPQVHDVQPSERASRTDDEIEEELVEIAEQTREKSREALSLNIRFSPVLSAWLKQFAEVQTRLTGRPVTMQQAANTILLIAKKEHDRSRSS